MPVGDGTCQAGGFIGYLQAIDRNVTFENNRVEGVTVTSGGLWEDQPEAASHVFVGNLINLSKTEKTICKFTGNSVTNCSLKMQQLCRGRPSSSDSITQPLNSRSSRL